MNAFLITTLTILNTFSAISFAEPANSPTKTIPENHVSVSSPPLPNVVISPPPIDSNSYILVDFNSHYIIASKDPEKRVEPASLTKMMSGYIVFTELKLGNINSNDLVNISEKAWKMPGSKMFIEVNKNVLVSDLVKGMDIQSGNDATVALAEHIAGSEENFVKLMNEYARQFGMNNSHFVNSTGLPNPNHYSTAKDLAILANAIIRDFPIQYSTYAKKQFTYNGITQYNRNKLLWQDSSVDGIKTGHTDSAGYCLVSSAKKNGMRLIGIVLGTDSAVKRVNESQKLLNYGFHFFKTHKLYNAGEHLVDSKIWEGTQDKIRLGLDDVLYVTIPRGRYKKLTVKTAVKLDIEAPILKGKKLGDLIISLNNKVIAKRNLIALEEVKQGSLLKRLTDSIKRWWNSLLSWIGM